MRPSSPPAGRPRRSRTTCAATGPSSRTGSPWTRWSTPRCPSSWRSTRASGRTSGSPSSPTFERTVPRLEVEALRPEDPVRLGLRDADLPRREPEAPPLPVRADERLALLQGDRHRPREPLARRKGLWGGRSLEHVDVLPRAQLLQDLGPDRDGDLTDVGLAEEEHLGTALADPAPDAQWDLAPQDRLVVRELEEVLLLRDLQLLLQRLRVHADPPVQPVHRAAVLGRRRRDPVVVVRGPHLVRVAVPQDPADPDDEDRGVLLDEQRLALLPREVRVHVQDVL